MKVPLLQILKNAKLQYPHMSSINNNAPFEKITVNLDKGVLGQILGIDLEKMLDSKHTAFQQDIVSENVDEEGNYIMPNYDYCDKEILDTKRRHSFFMSKL